MSALVMAVETISETLGYIAINTRLIAWEDSVHLFAMIASYFTECYSIFLHKIIRLYLLYTPEV